MATKIIDNNGIVSFDSISSEEDLNLRPRININPPSPYRRCECCGRHISELQPFGKAGDPMVGNFEGQLLIKKLRPMGPYDQESETAWAEAMKHFADIGDKDRDPLEWMIQKYGKEKGEHFYWADQLYSQSNKSRECRDCAVLDEDEYFEKLKERYSKEG